MTSVTSSNRCRKPIGYAKEQTLNDRKKRKKKKEKKRKENEAMA